MVEYIKYLLDLVELQDVIKKGKTGSAPKLARTMCTDRRTIYRRIDALRSLGAIIEYDPIQCTYYFVNEFTITFKINEKNPPQ